MDIRTAEQEIEKAKQANEQQAQTANACARMSARAAIETRISSLRSEAQQLERLLGVLPAELSRVAPLADQALFELVIRRR
jgi:hypothetical protein